MVNQLNSLWVSMLRPSSHHHNCRHCSVLKDVPLVIHKAIGEIYQSVVICWIYSWSSEMETVEAICWWHGLEQKSHWMGLHQERCNTWGLSCVIAGLLLSTRRFHLMILSLCLQRGWKLGLSTCAQPATQRGKFILLKVHHLMHSSSQHLPHTITVGKAFWRTKTPKQVLGPTWPLMSQLGPFKI